MKKCAMILLMFAAAAGCSKTIIDGTVFNQAVDLCSKSDGLDKFVVFQSIIGNHIWIYCNDTTIIKVIKEVGR